MNSLVTSFASKILDLKKNQKSGFDLIMKLNVRYLFFICILQSLIKF